MKAKILFVTEQKSLKRNEGIRMILIMVKKRLIKPFRVFDKFDSYLYSDFEYVLETPSSSTNADSPSKVSLVKLS